ncbi:MAG TPA: lasso peptide biosynthesis PqqD family chaperone [Niallia sp.]|nr:lasso peptide biosynthesis PqqD family chaperone [Niallia sp.]
MLKNKESLSTSLICQGTGNIVSNMENEKVLLSVKNSKYYNLGGVGGAIWDLIEKPLTLNNIVSSLMCEYDIDYTKCEDQVITFLEILSIEGLIELKEN